MYYEDKDVNKYYPSPLIPGLSNTFLNVFQNKGGKKTCIYQMVF